MGYRSSFHLASPAYPQWNMATTFQFTDAPASVPDTDSSESPKCFEFPGGTFWQVPLTYRIVGSLLGGMFILFGLTGNMLLVVSYIRYKNIRNPFNTILFSMSCNDLLFLLGVFPVLLAVYIRGTWLPLYSHSGDVDVLCVYVSLAFINCEISAMFHVLVAGFYRYAVVVHPFGKLERINKSRLWVTIMILAVYLVVFFVWSIPRMYGFSQVDMSDVASLDYASLFDTRRMLCGIPCVGGFTNVILTTGAFSIIAILCVMYVRILMVTRRSRRVRESNNKNNSNTGNTSQNKEIRFILIVSLLLLVCLVCYTALPLLSKMYSDVTFDHSLFFPFVVLNWIPPTCNWLLYTALTKDFTEAYKRLLCGNVYSANASQKGKSQTKTTVTNIG